MNTLPHPKVSYFKAKDRDGNNVSEETNGYF